MSVFGGATPKPPLGGIRFPPRPPRDKSAGEIFGGWAWAGVGWFVLAHKSRFWGEGGRG